MTTMVESTGRRGHRTRTRCIRAMSMRSGRYQLRRRAGRGVRPLGPQRRRQVHDDRDAQQHGSPRPRAASPRLGGLDVATDPIGTRARSSVVVQDTVVDQPLTGRQNLELHLRLRGRDYRRCGPDSAGRPVQAGRAGSDEMLDRPVATYSGGQRRRMEIVRALASDPQVLFLAEPTVGLETRVRHDLFDALATLRDRTGVTILMTTHYLDEAERLCDRIAIVDAGRVVACDSPANLLAALGSEVLELRADEPEKVEGRAGRLRVCPPPTFSSSAPRSPSCSGAVRRRPYPAGVREQALRASLGHDPAPHLRRRVPAPDRWPASMRARPTTERPLSGHD